MQDGKSILKSFQYIQVAKTIARQERKKEENDLNPGAKRGSRIILQRNGQKVR